MNTRIFILILTLFTALCLTSGAALARDAAARVILVKGEAWVRVGAARNPLEADSLVYPGDRLETGQKSNLYLRFRDDTRFALGPGASMTVDAYDDRENAVTAFATSILRGAFRFVSGLLAKEKPRGYRVRVTVGTIGVRGTAVAGEVSPRRETDDGIVEASARVMLLEDEQGDASAIEVFNDFGSVVIDQPGFGTEIADESSPPSPARRMQLRSINNLLRAIRGSVRGAAPRRNLR